MSLLLSLGSKRVVRGVSYTPLSYPTTFKSYTPIQVSCHSSSCHSSGVHRFYEFKKNFTNSFSLNTIKFLNGLGIIPPVPKIPKTPTKNNIYWLFIVVGGIFLTIHSASCEEEQKSLDTIPSPASLFQSDEVFPIDNFRNEMENKYWDLISKEIPLFVVAIAAALVASILGLKIQTLIGKLIDVAKTGGVGWQEVMPSILHFSGIVTLHTFFSFLYYSTISYAGEQMAARLRRNIFDKIIQLDISYFDEINSGEVLNRLESDVTEVRRGIQHMISEGIKHSTQIIGGVYSLYNTCPQLTYVAVIPVAILVSAGYLFTSFLKNLSDKAKDARAHAIAASTESVQNIRTVRAFANEEKESNKYKEMDGVNESESKKFGIYLGLLRAGTSFAVNGMVLGLLGFGAKLVSQQTISTGTLTSFLITSLAFFRSFGQMTVIFGKLSKAITAFDRICAITSQHPKIPITLPYAQTPTHFKGRIEFVHVKFAYPSRPADDIFEDFNLVLEEGQVLALVGPSGSGKTTVTSLIERFYDPLKGSILLDGIDIRSLDPTLLRKNIGIVSQEPVLFNTTILENISYGKPNATKEEIIEAAIMANCHLFVEGFPNGYYTVVGERGVQLSGGQKQRIAIARALLKDPKLLILDEATSALDTTSEKLVQSALSKLMKNRTVLVIAHRLSTVQEADQIVVINKGVVVERGTHEQLMEVGGEYKVLVEKQIQKETTK